MDRTTSRELWARIAAGELACEPYDGVDLHKWVREVAVRLLEVDEETDASGRPGRILAAVGLSGKVDGYADLRAFVNDPLWDFPLIDECGPIKETRAQLLRQMVELARKKGLLHGAYEFDDKMANGLLRKLVPKQI